MQMGYMWRDHPAMDGALQMARAGDLGRIYAVRATINKPLSAAERIPLARFRGGMMFEMGCHMIDRVVDVLGKPRKTTGVLRHDGPFDDGLADNTLAILEHDGGLGDLHRRPAATWQRLPHAANSRDRGNRDGHAVHDSWPYCA
ncbi:MAG: hypothetical protein R2748_11025 [Bryobacterales bacterium]